MGCAWDVQRPAQPDRRYADIAGFVCCWHVIGPRSRGIDPTSICSLGARRLLTQINERYASESTFLSLRPRDHGGKML
jgi:hypothetical protein